MLPAIIQALDRLQVHPAAHIDRSFLQGVDAVHHQLAQRIGAPVDSALLVTFLNDYPATIAEIE